MKKILAMTLFLMSCGPFNKYVPQNVCQNPLLSSVYLLKESSIVYPLNLPGITGTSIFIPKPSLYNSAYYANLGRCFSKMYSNIKYEAHEDNKNHLILLYSHDKMLGERVHFFFRSLLERRHNSIDFVRGDR